MVKGNQVQVQLTDNQYQVKVILKESAMAHQELAMVKGNQVQVQLLDNQYQKVHHQELALVMEYNKDKEQVNLEVLMEQDVLINKKMGNNQKGLYNLVLEFYLEQMQ